VHGGTTDGSATLTDRHVNVYPNAYACLEERSAP
jgi:hypothetical protein